MTTPAWYQLVVYIDLIKERFVTQGKHIQDTQGNYELQVEWTWLGMLVIVHVTLTTRSISMCPQILPPPPPKKKSEEAFVFGGKRLKGLQSDWNPGRWFQLPKKRKDVRFLFVESSQCGSLTVRSITASLLFAQNNLLLESFSHYTNYLSQQQLTQPYMPLKVS